MTAAHPALADAVRAIREPAFMDWLGYYSGIYGPTDEAINRAHDSFFGTRTAAVVGAGNKRPRNGRGEIWADHPHSPSRPDNGAAA